MPRLPDIAVVWTKPLPGNPCPRVLVWPPPGCALVSPVPTEGLPEWISLARLLGHIGHTGSNPVFLGGGLVLTVILQGLQGGRVDTAPSPRRDSRLWPRRSGGESWLCRPLARAELGKWINPSSTWLLAENIETVIIRTP